MMKLYPFQTNILKASTDKNRVAYFLDMGLGKTYIGAEKMVQLGKRVNLIVCQKSKIQDWIKHFQENYMFGENAVNIYDLTRKDNLANMRVYI